MNALPAFNAGFHDGYNHEKRKTRQGPVYIRAYKKGIEARDRAENGGEDTKR